MKCEESESGSTNSWRRGDTWKREEDVEVCKNLKGDLDGEV